MSFPFAVERHELGTIDGDMEAYYGVLAANYLEGRIDARLRPTGHAAGAMGALDMGEIFADVLMHHLCCK